MKKRYPVIILLFAISISAFGQISHGGKPASFEHANLKAGIAEYVAPEADYKQMLKEDLDHLGAEDLHQLQRAWELQHRVLASECVTHHTMFRKETRWPGYYYRGDHMKLDDTDWHCFTLSQYDKHSGNWEMEKAPVYHIVD